VRVLDLFSGIGGFSLGLERAGMTTAAFCEVDPFCRRVLAKHWPKVPCYDDVRTLTGERLAADGISVDVICGGFPCQDISVAGNGAGLVGERSGLWRDYARLIGEIRPRFVIVENVAALLFRGLGDVLGDLATFGYDAEWHCISAAAVGAPHRRDRVWIIAYQRVADADRRQGLHDLQLHPSDGGEVFQKGTVGELHRGSRGEDVADASGQGLPVPQREALLGTGRWNEGRAASGGGGWPPEPCVGRVAHGVSARVDRLRAIGNAVVPQIPELIGRAIMRAAA
jgi:DNA (cytosine-5)-methyltransferase 1